jgi:hypothetical protein
MIQQSVAVDDPQDKHGRLGYSKDNAVFAENQVVIGGSEQIVLRY